MGKLSGKVAIITGASKGIGAAIAKTFSVEGAAVLVNYASDKAGGERVASDIVSSGGKAFAVQGDVSRPEDAERIVAEAVARFGRLDVLVNNAGVFNFVPLEQVTEVEYRRHFDINVFGVLTLTKAAVPHLKDGGSIINVGSVANDVLPPTGVVYSATKGALDAITGVLANELGPRQIRVNSLKPGIVSTEGTRAAGFIGNAFEDALIARTPLGRAGELRDVADVALFLASDDSRFVTGERIRPSGGLR